jgi:hypothetical protein
VSQRYQQYERYEQYRQRPPNRGRSCLLQATVVVWIVVLACLGVRFLGRPGISDYVNRQIASRIDPEVAPDLNGEEALRDSLQEIPIGVPIPAGEIRVDELTANSYMDSYRDRLAGIDDMEVRFVPGAVEADVTFQGLTATARTVPQVQDGRIVATDSSLGQPLDMVLSVDGLMNALLDRINDEVAAQGRYVTGVEIQQDVAIVTVE